MENQEIRILVVDDDPEILFATERVIKSAGYQVSSAATGGQCLEIACRDTPDIILLDVDLPDILGTKVCSQLKNNPLLKQCYILMISGSRTSSGDQADGLDSGADGYVARPVSNRELLARVAALVRILMAERERDQLIDELKKALEKIKVLSGIVPICMHCKQIRDDKGYWNRIESYISNHSEMEFSHGICDKCLQEHYPEDDPE